MVVNLRQRIEALGGQFCFSTRLSDIITTNKALVAIKTVSPQGEEVLDCSCLVLATGHSARDTYEMLWRRGVALEPKGDVYKRQAMASLRLVCLLAPGSGLCQVKPQIILSLEPVLIPGRASGQT